MAHVVSAIFFAVLFVGLGAAATHMVRAYWADIAAALRVEGASPSPVIRKEAARDPAGVRTLRAAA